jgi:hypothetical protein
MGSARRNHTDVRNVGQIFFETMTVKGFAARACHEGTRLLRRHPLAGFPHRIFPRGPVLLIAPGLKISFGSFRRTTGERGYPVR